MLLSAIVMLLIILSLTITLLLTIEPIQNFAARKVADFASTKIGSKVEIGGVNFSMMNNITLRDFLLEDIDADTLIFASRVDLKISRLSLLEGEVKIGRASLEDGEVHLREMEDGQLNIKYIVDRLSNPDREEPSDFMTTISSIEVKDIDFSLERKRKFNPSYGIDFGDMQMHIEQGEVSDFTTQNGVTRLSAQHFVGREVSGFEVRDLRGELTIKNGELIFSELSIDSAESQINFSELTLKGSSWEDFARFVSDVEIEANLKKSTLSTADLAYFAPTFKGSDIEFSQITARANGHVDDFNCDIKSLGFGESSLLKAQLAVKDGQQIQDARFEFDVKSLRSNSEDINTIMEQAGLNKIDTKRQEMISRLGTIEVETKGQGNLYLMNIDTLLLKSELGQLSFEGSLRELQGDNIGCRGTIESFNFELGRLLGQGQLGGVSLVSTLDVSNSRQGMDAAIDSYVNSLYYNNYTYSGINIDALLDGKNLHLDIASHEKNFDFSLKSTLQFDDQKSKYDIMLRVDNADLHALTFNKRDSISQVSGSFKMQLEGSNIDNISGRVLMRNINYMFDDKTLYTPIVDVELRNSETEKLITLESDYLDVNYRSKSPYSDIVTFLKEDIQLYIPLLYHQASQSGIGQDRTYANNFSSLDVKFKQITPLCEALFEGFAIADNSEANLYINPNSGNLSLSFMSDAVIYDKFCADKVDIQANNLNDSLSLYTTAQLLSYGKTQFPSLVVLGGARNDELTLWAELNDKEQNNSARLDLRAKFDGERNAQITLGDSKIILGEQVWRISADQIETQRGSIYVDNFAMTNKDQNLQLDGIISKSETDTLSLKLHDYNIAMITSVIGDMGYEINGLSSGEVCLSALLAEPRVLADVQLDQVDVNSIPSPPLRLQALWSSNQNRAGLFVTNRHNDQTVVTGYYAPSNMRYYAKLQVDSLNVGLIEPLLKTTITDTRGYANVNVSLNGQNKKASLHGNIDIYDVSTKLLYTQVTYRVPKGRIEIDDNVLSSKNAEVFDKENNRGLLTMNLSLDHLSNVSYRLRMTPENMLVLNTTLEDNELFYGTLYATGVATIEGDKRGVNMDITATSQPNSEFFMPLSTKSSVAKTDFISFVKPNESSSNEDGSSINARNEYIQKRLSSSSQTNSRLNIAMALHATPDLDFQFVIDPVVGDIIKAKGEGRLNLAIAPQDNIFEMYGDYDINEGSYLFTLLNPISKRFEIDSGSSIQWTGNPMDPMLNIDAVYKVKTSLDPLVNVANSDENSSSRAVPVDCIIHLGDRLSQPSVDFSIEVPTADTEQQAIIANTLIDQETISQQFFYLMLANSFIPVSSSIGNDLGSSTTASTGFELLTNQLSNWLSSTNYNVVIRYRPESTLTSDEVDVGFSRGLIDNRLLIEVEGNYLADNKAAMDDNNFSNFMGEAYVTWLIDRAGVLRLKGFTQTIDRYDENQGLQETGIGIYYSESFNNFKELGRKIRDRFRKKDE
ncbi:MAG: translocation/assembly module TamB domain-containing protein [Rikenellaceae bacterium]